MAAISTGYRLALEDLFPAGLNDCVDMAEYLADNGQSLLSAPLRVIGGASAGGNHAAVATLQLPARRCVVHQRHLRPNSESIEHSSE